MSKKKRVFMGVAENQECPKGKTNFVVWIENGAC